MINGKERMTGFSPSTAPQPRDSGPIVIDVHVNKMYDAGSSPSERDPGERTDISFFQRKNGPTKRIPCTALLVER